MSPRRHPGAQAHRALLKLGDIRNASLGSDSLGDFNLSLSRRVQDMESDEFSICETVYFYPNNDIDKADFKWQRRGILIGKFGRTVPILYYRWNSIEVDLNDRMPTGKISEVL